MAPLSPRTFPTAYARRWHSRKHTLGVQATLRHFGDMSRRRNSPLPIPHLPYSIELLKIDSSKKLSCRQEYYNGELLEENADDPRIRLFFD